jgi:methylated-DNA-[protein]-cysteine S-methyltransferase
MAFAQAALRAVVPAPFGAMGIRHDGECLTELEFLDPGAALLEPADALSRETALQLAAYFADARFAFRLPTKRIGTDFQRRVWEAISAVPCGTRRTYGDIARDLGSVPRAVGQACGSNAYPLVIPCHRVVAAAGLGGFAHSRDGFLPGVKRWLLHHEGVASA